MSKRVVMSEKTSHIRITFIFRLFLGLNPSWKKKKFTFLGTDWSYEIAVLCKGYECFLEAGYQTLLQTYINMRTEWHGWLWLKQWLNGGNLIGKKGYIINQGKVLTVPKSNKGRAHGQYLVRFHRFCPLIMLEVSRSPWSSP